MAEPDYGTDVQALDDLPDPEVLCGGETNAAYASGRRLLTPTGALEEIGETEEYDSIDVREWLGARRGEAERASLETQASQVLTQDPRVLSSEVEVALGKGALQLEASLEGTEGPFSLVLSVDDVTTKLMRGT